MSNGQHIKSYIILQLQKMCTEVQDLDDKLMFSYTKMVNLYLEVNQATVCISDVSPIQFGGRGVSNPTQPPSDLKPGVLNAKRCSK